MAKTHKLYCRPADGRFNWEKQFDLQNLPAKLAKYGRVVVEFKKYTPMKSLKQMGYYRGGVLPWLEKEFIADTGLNRNDWHELLKHKCGIIKDLDNGLSYPKSLADYTESEMSMFITKIGQFVLEWMNASIPPATVIEEYLS